MAWIDIVAADTDADSPIDEDLMDAFRQNLDLLRAANFLQSVFASGIGGDGSDGDYAPSVSANLDVGGGKEYSTITIPAGVTITITAATDGIAKIGCQGDCAIAGAIVVNALGTAGGSGTTVGADGGDSILRGVFGATGGGGGGGAVGGSDGGSSGYVGAVFSDGSAANTGVAGTAGRSAVYSARMPTEDRIPPMLLGPATGGGEGGADNTRSGGDGGTGGGCLIIEVAGDLDFTGSITANGSAGAAGITSGGEYSGGGGGGGGGTVSIVAYTATATSGTITTNGGAAGASPGSTAGAGGAGGAGYSQLIELAA